MKHVILYCLIILSCTATAQENLGKLFASNMDRGDRYYIDEDYTRAISYYRSALKKDGSNAGIKLKIADSYRKMRDYPSAVRWYSSAFEGDAVQDSEHIYNYAQALTSAEDYEEAIVWYRKYLDTHPDDKRALKKIAGLETPVLFYGDSGIYRSETLPFNTRFSEMAAVPFHSGVVFSSARKSKGVVDPDRYDEVDLYDLFTVNSDSSGNWSDVVPFDKKLNSPFHEGSFTFNGPSAMLFTRSNYYDKKQVKRADGKTTLQIFEAARNDEGWSSVRPFEWNNSDYNVAFPALNATGDTLYFASDKAGGYGGFDLYRSVKSGSWSDPVNMGPEVNTAGDEVFPFFTHDRLYFASDGREGLGGLDVYRAYVTDGMWEVANMGAPVNSPKDDFAFLIDPVKRSGFYTSNRNGGRGSDDIYAIDQLGLMIKGLIVEEQSGEALRSVRVDLIQDGLTIATVLTGGTGMFTFEVPFGGDYTIKAHKNEYTLIGDVSLSSRGQQLDFDTLELHMYKHDFFARGIVYDNITQAMMHDVTVILQDDETHERDSVLTTQDGLYSFVLRPGRDYTLFAKKDRFISDSLKINTRAISRGVITNDFVLDEIYIDKETIFFDYNEADLRQDAYAPLKKVVEIMKRFPNDWVIIGAHADSRGTVEYNQALSERRAKAVVDYFVANGIKRSQIIARGFGEGLVINRCVDGVNCHEEDHSKNRRAEIAVEEKLPEEEFETEGFR